jgi:hypothetical protein
MTQSRGKYGGNGPVVTGPVICPPTHGYGLAKRRRIERTIDQYGPSAKMTDKQALAFAYHHLEIAMASNESKDAEIREFKKRCEDYRKNGFSNSYEVADMHNERNRAVERARAAERRVTELRERIIAVVDVLQPEYDE